MYYFVQTLEVHLKLMFRLSHCLVVGWSESQKNRLKIKYIIVQFNIYNHLKNVCYYKLHSNNVMMTTVNQN